MRKKATSEGEPAKGSNVIPFPNRKGASKAEPPRPPEKKVARSRAERAREAYARAARMKARRAGGFAPPVNPDAHGEYLTVAPEFDGLAEYGYPAGTMLLVRTDVEVPLGRLAMCERADTGGGVIGPVVRDVSGNLRIDSLTCGLYGYPIRQIVGLVLGPLASEAEAERVLGPITGERPTVEPAASQPAGGDDWPEYIYDGGDS
jgi:hypothetical protein